MITGDVGMVREAWALVADRSASVEGGPLERARLAAGDVVATARVDDLIAVVSFEDVAEVQVPLASTGDKAALWTALAAWQPGGATNLWAGWEAGAAELRRSGPVRDRHLLLITDGWPNVGELEVDVMVERVLAAWGNEGIRTSCVALSTEADEELLSALAKAGYGWFREWRGERGRRRWSGSGGPVRAREGVWRPG